MTKCDIAIIGGDSRTAYMAPYFAKKGWHVICCNTVNVPYSRHLKSKIQNTGSLRECISASSIIVCGIPFSKGEHIYCEKQTADFEITVAEFQRCVRRHQTIFAGVIPESFRAVCEEREIYCHDFMLDEPLSILNAVSTAEGAILEALLHKSTVIHKSSCLVLGFGRCGKIIADRLKGLCACVTVCTKSDTELALASSLGFHTLKLSKLPQTIHRFEYLFNTIPACILNRSCLERVSKDCLIIDIASNRTGADYEAAKQLGINLRCCPGLPGKYSGKSCAKQLSEYVVQHICK
ncbi:MAG: dipicolinate synthase [Lachnospiraceae bacterium]|nr:dipicolinate synthase [Lachnospiraceae bacterium]